MFVVASARDDINPAEILFEFEGVRRDIAPSRQARENVTQCTQRSPANSKWPADISCTLDTTFGSKQGLEDQHINAGCPMFVPDSQPQIVGAIDCRIGAQRAQNAQAGHMLPIPIHDQDTRHAGKNGEKTMGKGNGLGIGQPGDPMNTLTKGDHHAVAYNIAPAKVN